MEKEFVDYWNTHQKHLILNAPEGLRKEYFDSNRLDTPIDWICFLIPIAVGILLQTFMGIASTIVSMGITIVVVVLLYALMQMVKPYLSQKNLRQKQLRESRCIIMSVTKSRTVWKNWSHGVTSQPWSN